MYAAKFIPVTEKCSPMRLPTVFEASSTLRESSQQRAQERRHSSTMAPIWPCWIASSPTMQLFRRDADAPSSAATNLADYLAAQWRNPSDILSVLLLVGPEVVQAAIAQLAGRAVTPVAFSFGWVAYAPSALLSSFGGIMCSLLAHDGRDRNKSGRLTILFSNLQTGA